MKDNIFYKKSISTLYEKPTFFNLQRNRRAIDEKLSVDIPQPHVHEPLRPGKPYIQILPAAALPSHN